MSKIACIFPGQGSQSVGMGADLHDQFQEARTTFAEIDRAAGRQLSRLCFDGPEPELKRTVNTQPTILAVSLAAWRCYQSLLGPVPAFVAGHSLGEFSALLAAEVLSTEAAVRLVEKRAQLMEECPPGAMSAVIGVEAAALEKCCQAVRNADANDVVIVANFNTREQLVISGSAKAVVQAGQAAKALGGKVIPLPVGGAFHSPLMSSAAGEFRRELEKFTFSDALIPVVQNFDAKSAASATEIKAKLNRQMESSVRWCESVEFMLEAGVDTFIEIGPGKFLSGMVKKIDPKARVFSISDSSSLKTTLQSLKGAVRLS